MTSRQGIGKRTSHRAKIGGAFCAMQKFGYFGPVVPDIAASIVVVWLMGGVGGVHCASLLITCPPFACTYFMKGAP